ncbi:exodeoxyribonuclease VII large subunit [Ahrensia marina]|uniref:Exodeoxyribonuclease 7 large subunit n=1 Tax=Ahrensia marina TaxID=1514904 RepID=A0A0M9GPT4_9HYPH|nr:exodeoxyribonuclease VII large subunit [Ahrensia marina]KPB02526.1 exodeoxyribonuclease VII large subunit [Ahrensia marina]
MSNIPAPNSNVTEFSVTELSGAIKRTMEDTYGRVRVRGELGRVSRPASGHIYLDLKDDRAVLAAVIWKGAAAKMAVRPEEGLEVIATGKITTFPGQSKYQLVIDNIEPAGEGALMALLAARKRQLESEGLFDPARKQLLPYMPRVIGVVTSPTGAVIRDILHRLSDRFPSHVLVWPVRVQGETSAQEVATAVRGFNAIDGGSGIPKPDLIIVARGGGSLEDLWGFNEEVVVRAVADSDIPVISAVGHETDTTLVDYAADVRAPTPTGAAEIAVPVQAELVAQMAQLVARLRAGLSRSTDRKKERLSGLTRALPHPDGLLALPRQRLDGQQVRLGAALDRFTTHKRSRLTTAEAKLSPSRLIHRFDNVRSNLDRLSRSLPSALGRNIQTHRRELGFRAQRLSPQTVNRNVKSGREQLVAFQRRNDLAAERLIGNRRDRANQVSKLLESYSYQRVLDRGFALVMDESAKPIRSSKGVAKGAGLTIQFAGDDRLAAIANGDAIPAMNKRSSAKPQKKQPKAAQTSLFDE